MYLLWAAAVVVALWVYLARKVSEVRIFCASVPLPDIRFFNTQPMPCFFPLSRRR